VSWYNAGSSIFVVAKHWSLCVSIYTYIYIYVCVYIFGLYACWYLQAPSEVGLACLNTFQDGVWQSQDKQDTKMSGFLWVCLRMTQKSHWHWDGVKEM
jgi:hypothetical protein